MISSKIRIPDLEFILISIYITSKMLWDTIPYFFELFFWGIVLMNSFIFLCISIIKKRNSKIILLFILLSGYILFNAIIKDTRSQLLRCVYEYIVYALILFYFVKIREKVNLNFSLRVISWWGAIIAALTWFEYATKSYILTDLSDYGIIFNVGSNGFRSTVFTRSFLSHGVVLGIFSLVFLYLWNQYRKKKYIIGCGICFSAILATGSRGPLVAFFCAITFFWFYDVFIIEKKYSKKNQFILGGIIGAVMLLIILAVNVNPSESTIGYFVYRIQNIFNWKGDAGNAGRIVLWTKSINDYFMKAPLLGIGPSKTGSWGEGSLGVTESGLLKRLCELGIVGFILFYLTVIYILKKAKNIHNIEHKREMEFWLSIFIGIFINDITVQSTEEIMVAFWWWCSLGAIYYLSQMDGKCIDLKNIQ